MNNAPVSPNPVNKPIGPLSLNQQIQGLQPAQAQVTPQAPAKAPVQAPIQPQPEVKLEQKPDTVEIQKPEEQAQEPKEKKGLLEKWANFVGSVKKFFTKAGEYGAGGVKGAGAFLGGAAGTVAGIFTIHQVKAGVKAAQENSKNVIGQIFGKLAKGVSRNLNWNTLKKTLKSGKGIGSIAAGIGVGALAFLAEIYKAKLNVNEKTADIDHRYVDNVHKA